jgi:hypothetical protein
MAKQSGVIDAIYQVIISPDTYLTAGLSKIPLIGPKLARTAIAKGADEAGFLVAGQGNKGRVLADKILAAKPEELNLTVRETFQRQDVFGLWQNEVGPVIKAFTEAEGNTAKAEIFRNFRIAYPEFNDLAVFKLYAKNNVFDAASAEKFFTTADNARYLIGGRLDGTSFYRNGIATARASRQFTSGIARKVDALFNPTVGNIAARDTLEKATAAHERGWEILTRLGEEADLGVNPNITKLIDIESDMSKTRKLSFKIGTAAGRRPTSGGIRYGDDAIDTVSEFRNMAALVVDRDFADTWALNYLDLDRFFAWAAQYPDSLITFNEIQEPSFLDFRLIPPEVRPKTFNLGNNVFTPAWFSFIADKMHQTRQPTQEECNLLKQYAQVWDYRCNEKFLNKYPWASYIIEKARI